MNQLRLAHVVAALAAMTLALIGGASPASAAPTASTKGILTGKFVSGIDGTAIPGTLWIRSLQDQEVKGADIPAGAFKWSLPPGSYIVEFDASSTPGLIVPFYIGNTNQFSEAQVISVRAGKTTALGTRTVPEAASISGQIIASSIPSLPPSPQISVYDDAGDEVGYGWVGSDGSFTTGGGLFPGTYRVGVTLPKFDGAFYGGTTLQTATPIVVGAGEAVTGIEIAPRPWSKLAGNITYPDGWAGNKFFIVQLATEDGTPYPNTAGLATYAQGDGPWSLQAPPGRYKILFTPVNGMNTRGLAGQWLGGAQFPEESPTVEVGTADISGLDTTVVRGGLIQIVATAPSTFTGSVAVDLFAKNADGAWQIVRGTTYDHNGFEIDGMLPGDYVLRVSDPSADPVFPAIFYQNSKTAGGARVLTVTASTSPPVVYQDTAPIPPSRAIVSDLDEDGKADVVFSTSANGPLSVAYGNGSGGFRETDGYGVADTSGYRVFSGSDFVKFGPSELLAYRPGDGFYLWDENGPGAKIVADTRTYTTTLGVGDWDRDGKSDIIVRDSAGVMWLYPGDGHGGVKPIRKLKTGWRTYSLVASVGNLAGDSGPDIVARDPNGVLWIYPSTSTGAFAPRVRVGAGWKAKNAVFGVGDFTGDGRCDLLARDTSGRLWLYAGRGAGKFAPRVSLPGNWKPAIFA